MGNLLDSAISSVAPGWGASRARSRLKLGQLERAAGVAHAAHRRYEGATVGRRTGGWITSSSGPNVQIGPALARLRNRSRDLVQNNQWAAKAIRVLANNIIGTGIKPQARSENEKEAARFQEIFQEWAESTDCDADGRRNYYAMQKLAQREISEAGEVLVRRRRRRPSDRFKIPLQLQVLEPDFIDLSHDGTDVNGNETIQGVEFDRLGRRRFYWLYDNHPGERGLFFRRGLISRRVPAEAVLHIFREERAGQVHGVPWCSSALIKIQELDQFEDAELVRAKIASMLVAFVHDIDSEVEADDTSDPDNPIDKLEAGMVEHLPPGKDVRFNTPPKNDGYVPFAEITLRAVAAAFGITYEALTGDLSNVTFSSGRMGWLEFHREVESWRRLEFIPQFCVPTWRWFGQAVELSGLVPRALPATWTPPRREMIDPGREIRALKEQIGAGLISLSEAIRQLGFDPKSLLAELSSDLEAVDKLGIVLDLAATLKSNAAQEVQGTGGEGDNSTFSRSMNGAAAPPLDSAGRP